MEYRVVEMEIYNLEGFEGSVNSLMHEGWKLKGGVNVANGSSGHPTFYQAMIRNVPLPPVPQRSSAVVGGSSSDSGGGFSRKKSKRRLRKTQYRSKRRNRGNYNGLGFNEIKK